MASIARRHAYRFGYLKSEHWANLRLAKLAEQDACCQACDHRDLSNDVHHVLYRESLYDTSLDDLVVLCRDCHERVHCVLERWSHVNATPDVRARWKATLKCLKRLAREPRTLARAVAVNGAFPELGACPSKRREQGRWFAVARRRTEAAKHQNTAAGELTPDDGACGTVC